MEGYTHAMTKLRIRTASTQRWQAAAAGGGRARPVVTSPYVRMWLMRVVLPAIKVWGAGGRGVQAD